MLRSHWLVRTTSVVLCVLISLPVVAADVTVSNLGQSPSVLDVRLREDHTMVGKLVNRQGKPLSNVSVEVLAKRRAPMMTKTDLDGIFVIPHLETGDLTLRMAGQTQMIRVWAFHLAPPRAPSAVLLVVGDTVRGQCCGTQCPTVCRHDSCTPDCGGCDSCCGYGAFGGRGGNAYRLLSNPIVLGSMVGAAIAIPLAIDDDDAS